jgi:hypothetical protein
VFHARSLESAWPWLSSIRRRGLLIEAAVDLEPLKAE